MKKETKNRKKALNSNIKMRRFCIQNSENKKGKFREQERTLGNELTAEMKNSLKKLKKNEGGCPAGPVGRTCDS